MKQKFLFLVPVIFSFLFLFACESKEAKKFSFSPENPQPGESVTVVYNPSGTELEDESGIELLAYFYSQPRQIFLEWPEVKVFPMKKKGSLWQAKMDNEKNTRLVILVFQSGKKVDSNVRRGYMVNFFDKEGNQVPGSLASLADALTISMKINLDRDADRALSLLEEEFQLHPQMKREYARLYFSLISQLGGKNKDKLILQTARELSLQENLTLDELVLLEFWYRRIKDSDEAQKYDLMIRERDPAGEYVQGKRITTLVRAESLKEKIRLQESFRKDFPNSSQLWIVVTFLISSFQEAGKFIDAVKYLEDHPEGLKWRHYHFLAKEMAENNIEIESASRIAAKAVEIAQKDLRNPDSDEKPAYRTDQEWENQLRSNLGSSQDTLGFAFLKLGKEQEALDLLEKAVLNTSGEMTEINEHYSDALARIGNPEKALEEIGGFLQTEYSTARMKDLLKQAYVRKNGNDQGFDQYLRDLDEKFSKKLLADLKENIIKEPAPDFSLQDLEGNQVILSELKGKVVVLDFWATWCTYCLDSFPGMQETIKKYHGQDDIRFLFIDSWEYVEKEEKKQTVADLVAKKKLPFRVLLDLEDKVIEAYKIRSIPTKLIIDKEGNIRFKKIGFEGNTQKMVEELSRMIEMIR